MVIYIAITKSGNNHKPPAKNHKWPPNNQKPPANEYKLPGNNHKLWQNKRPQMATHAQQSKKLAFPC